MIPAAAGFRRSSAILGFASLVLCIGTGPCASGAEAIDATRVRLLPGSPFYDRQELHRRRYLASFSCDKLLFHDRALAGLPQPEGVSCGYAILSEMPAFTAHDAGPAEGIVFRPLYQVHHERYSVYWRLVAKKTTEPKHAK